MNNEGLFNKYDISLSHGEGVEIGETCLPRGGEGTVNTGRAKHVITWKNKNIGHLLRLEIQWV